MHPRFYVPLVVFVGLGLAGCGGTNVTPGSSALTPASQTAVGGPNTAKTLGNFGSLGAMLRSSPAFRVKPDKASYKRALYVYDYDSSIKILTNTYYRDLGVITDIGLTYELYMDQEGNLYAANSTTGGGKVDEYGPGDTSPSFTYNAGYGYPIAVTVDRHGNVYEGGTAGIINEYFQGFNKVVESCALSGGALIEGMAVDTSGDVFASFPGVGVYEYKGGLRGCSPTKLSALPYGASKIALDSNNDIIAETLYDIDVIAPPYYSITRTISSSQAGVIYGLSLNKSNKLLFVAMLNNGIGNVLVYNYQTGALVKTLGAAYGLSMPSAVVDGPNAVY